MKIKKTLNVNSGSNYMDIALSVISTLEQGIYDMIIMDKEGARSHDQNSLLWGVIYKGLSDTTGYTQEELHDILRMKFDLKDEDGKLLSTATLTKTEFNDYLDKIINWSRSLGIQVEKTGT